MLVKRTAERKLLEEQYAMPGSNLVVLYGRKGMGKTTLLSEFLKDKQNAYYYEGTECDHKLQLLCINQQALLPDITEEVLDYPFLFLKMTGGKQEKTIIILDEFHYIIKNSPDMIQALSILGEPNRQVMLVLCSSSIRWVENEMLDIFGDYAVYITAYLKLKEFSFVDFVNRFPNSSVETCVCINAILGGIPEYLDEWRENQSVAENLSTILLNKNSRFFMSPQHFLKLELREPAVYNTILYALARGNRKLNDLHLTTGFSRAKISVYLKHLIQLDLVEKLVPLKEEGRENVKKGLYRIKDNFFCFWYQFIFPNLSDLMLGKADEVYQNKIYPFFEQYVQEYFADVCTEYLKLMNLHNRLPDVFLWWDRWYGKNGTIDVLAQTETEKNLIGKCIWEAREADTKDYEDLITLAEQAGTTLDYCYLFARGGFTQQLREKAADVQNNLILIGLEEL